MHIGGHLDISYSKLFCQLSNLCLKLRKFRRAELLVVGGLKLFAIAEIEPTPRGK